MQAAEDAARRDGPALCRPQRDGCADENSRRWSVQLAVDMMQMHTLQQGKHSQHAAGQCRNGRTSLVSTGAGVGFGWGLACGLVCGLACGLACGRGVTVMTTGGGGGIGGDGDGGDGAA